MIHPLPPVLDADALLSQMSELALVATLKSQHQQRPPTLERCYQSQGENGFLIWPAWRDQGALGAKLVTIMPGNSQHGEHPNVHSTYVLFDAKTGAVRCFIVGEQFTRWKTAADSALAASFLARPDSQTLLIIGAGAQAYTHVQFMLAIRPSLHTVLLYNRTASKAQALAQHLARPGLTCHAVADLANAASEADLICGLSASTQPILQGAWLKAGCHVDLVGGFTPTMREGDDQLLRQAQLYVDHRDIAPQHCGDLTQPLAQGVISPAHILGDLFDLCHGRIQADPQAQTVFKNGGGGHLDLMMAEALYQQYSRLSMED